MPPIDYSKWDKLDVSDSDDDESTPNPHHSGFPPAGGEAPQASTGMAGRRGNAHAWAQGLGKEDRFEWLCDCYRLRMDDLYQWGGGNLRGCMNFECTVTSLVREFLLFAKLVVLAEALPKDGDWDWPSFLSKAAGMVGYAFEKQDAKERWGGENVFAAMTGGRSLRFTGEIIYGSSVQDPDESLEKLILPSVEEAFPGDGISDTPAGRKACEDVGGWEAWRNFYGALVVNPGPNVRGGL